MYLVFIIGIMLNMLLCACKNSDEPDDVYGYVSCVLDPEQYTDGVSRLFEDEGPGIYPHLCEYLVEGNTTSLDFDIIMRYGGIVDKGTSLNIYKICLSDHKSCGCSLEEWHKNCDVSGINPLNFKKSDGYYCFENGFKVKPITKDGTVKIHLEIPENKKMKERIVSIIVNGYVKEWDAYIWADAKIYQLPKSKV